MNCVKCGRGIPEDQVFCETCLQEMENYPVNPGTAVHVPARPAEDDLPKKPVKKKHVPTAEELLLRTRKKPRRSSIKRRKMAGASFAWEPHPAAP